MSICPACNGLVGRDCFNPRECMDITQQQAAMGRQMSDPGMVFSEDMHRTITRQLKQIDDLEKKNANLRESVIFLENRIAVMNEVFGKVRMAVGGNQFDQRHPEDLDQDGPWLPVGLMQEIDGVMTREYRR